MVYLIMYASIYIERERDLPARAAADGNVTIALLPFVRCQNYYNYDHDCY